jgi:hypothetical protein
MNVAAIMPCRGRAEQTVSNVKRLLATAGYEDWRLVLVCDGDRNVYNTLRRELPDVTVGGVQVAQGYWRCLDQGMRQQAPEATHLVNLANDLLPGMHWLRRAVAAYEQTFGTGDGMIGFNGDSHEVGHSCHFLISRSLLDRYGGWPVWYQHNFGDTELCQRAIADGVYAKAPWALLFHDHPFFGGQDDAIYAEGRATAQRDEQLYKERRRQGWPSVIGSASSGASISRTAESGGAR